MRCSGCGNTVPSWAGGSCPTCARNRRDERRFGAHPSFRRQTRPTSEELGLPSSCAVQGGGRFTLPAWLEQAENPIPSYHCRVCGCDIPQDKINAHLKLHARARCGGRTQGQARQKPLRPGGCPTGSDGADPLCRADAASVQPSPQVRRRRHAVNELLTDIYEKRYFLSDILRKGGVSQAEISTIYEERLLTFLDQLLAMWETAFVGKLDPGSWHVLTHSYGLDGLPRASALSLAQELALPEQRVTELRQDALRSLRTPACSGYLEHLAITVARLQFEASAATPGRRE